MKARPPGRESSSPDNINTRGPPGSVIKLSSDQIRQFPVAARAMRNVFDKTAQKRRVGTSIAIDPQMSELIPQSHHDPAEQEVAVVGRDAGGAFIGKCRRNDARFWNPI